MGGAFFGTSSDSKVRQNTRIVNSSATVADNGVSIRSDAERSYNNNKTGNITVSGKGASYTSTGITSDALTEFATGLRDIFDAQGGSTGTGLMSNGPVADALADRVSGQVADAGSTDARRQTLIVLGIIAALLILAGVFHRNKS